jgi:hypothetical protein
MVGKINSTIKNHLNWAMVLSSSIILFVYGFVSDVIPNYEIYIFLLAILIIVIIQGWYLKQKGRSKIWLLLNFVPFGLIFMLELKNNRTLLRQTTEV